MSVRVDEDEDGAESMKSHWSKELNPDLSPEPGPSETQLEPHGVQFLRPGLKKYSLHLRPDMGTISTKLRLADGKVTHVEEEQSYPEGPDRFERPQLLYENELTGRCYWEVQCEGWVDITVSYRRPRSGKASDRFGENDHSWSLRFSDGVYSVCHDRSETHVPSSIVSKKVAVYVDRPAGTLSFYRVSSNSLIHIDTFNTDFTEPLYPGFGLWSVGSSVSL